MSTKLEGRALELMQDKNYATISTVRRDGTILAAVIWADVDDDGRVVVNSAEGRTWPANVRRAGHATVTVSNRDNDGEFVSVTGTVEVDAPDEDCAVIDALSHKYVGADYPRLPESRVTFRLRPTRVTYTKL